MIEVNLIPDVKQELISARRTRSTVVSIAILAMLISGGVVVVLALYVFAGQSVRNAFANSAIKSEYKELQDIKDLSNMMTVQNQLAKITQTHADKTVSSRLFDVLLVAVPEPPNNVSLTSTKLDTELGTLTIEGQSSAGFVAYEAFKKTIAATTIEYSASGSDDVTKAALASDIIDGERSYGEDQTGNRVLRFSMTFTYEPALFAATSKRMIIQGPERRNATDSALAIPESLFAAPVNSTGESR